MSERIPFVDVQGLAGAWTLGTVQAGFDLRHRVSLPGGFGDVAMEFNRHLVGDGWQQEVGTADECTPQNGVAYACGTPPCSGFSLLNTSKGKNARGSGSDINHCMKELILYAASCTGLDGKQGPEIVSFESVQGAYKQGRNWMLELRDLLSERTGSAYTLTHVLMSGSSVGSAQMRHRYYFVAHRIPFSVETPQPTRVVTYADAIDDLRGLSYDWDPQVIKREPVSDFAARARRRDGLVTDHVPPHSGAFVRLVEELAPHWKPGEDIHKALHRYGKRPAAIKESKWKGTEFKEPVSGWSWPTRIHPDKPGYVLTGAGVLGFVHYAENRLLSVRETARLMGYPDDWSWSFAKSPMQASMLIGKCCPVNSGKWISGWASQAIRAYHNEEQLESGDVEQLGEREFYHNSTNVYRPVLKQQLEEAHVG